MYGSVLKVNSTKKVCKKLQGAVAGTATWITNVGNERGKILMSVVTDLELYYVTGYAKGLITHKCNYKSVEIDF